jgi:hypothetical protein
MDKSFILLIVCLVVIFVLSGNVTETLAETFVPNDPKGFVDGCNVLIKEKANVDKLISVAGCTDGINPLDFMLPFRDGINKKRICKDLTDKKIMLASEQPSWCDRVGQGDKAALVDQNNYVPPTILDGPEYMETQYSKVFGNLAPNDIGSTNLMSFVDMETPASNGSLAPTLK